MKNSNQTINKTDQSVNNKLSKVPGRFTKNMNEILLQIAKGQHTITTISKTTKKDKSQVYTTINSLIKKKLVTKEDKTRQYFLSTFGKEIVIDKLSTKTSKGSSTINKTINKTDKRGHNFRVKYPIVSYPPGWKESPKSFFKLQNLEYEELNLKNVDGVQFTYDNFFIKAMVHNIVVFVDESYGKNTLDVVENQIKDSDRMRNRLEKRFKGLRLGIGRVITNEYAHEKEIVARLKNKYTVIRHKDGYVRVQIDKSKGIELEFMHPGMADTDSEKWERQIIEVLDSPYSYNQLNVMIEQEEFRNDEQDHKMDYIVNVMNNYAKAINMHLDVEERKLENEKRTAHVLEKLERTLSKQSREEQRIETSKNNLESLKQKIKKKGDVLKHKELVKSLTTADKYILTDWLITRFD